MPSRRDVAIRLSAEGVRATEGQLTGLGTRGQQALQRLERSTAPVSRGLIAVDRATGGLRNQMEGMSRQLGIVGDAMRGLGPAGLAASAAIASLATGLTVAVRAANRAIESLSAIADTADRLGVTAETLQELRFAAEQNGVATNTLEMAWQRFTRRLGEAQNGTGELLGVLEQYNIALQNADGTNRRVIDVYRDFADAVRSVRDPQEQLRLAFKAFDSEGAALVRLLRQGSAGFDELAASAREAGVVFDNEVVGAAQSVGDQMNLLQQQQEAALTRIGLVFTEAALVWEQAKTDVLTITATIVEAFEEIEPIIDTLLSVHDLLTRAGAINPIGGVIRGLRGISGGLNGDNEGPVVLDPIEVRPGAGIPIPRPRAPEPTSSPSRPSAAGASAAERELQALLRRGAAIAASVRTPYEQMTAKQRELNELLEAGAINVETFERASKQSFQQFLESTDGAADGLGDVADAGEDAAARMQAAWDEATRGMTRSLADFFATGEFDFRRFIGNIAAALVQAQLDRLIVQPASSVFGGFGDFLGNLFGGGVGNTGPTGSSFAAELAGGVRPLHSGGVVGRDGGPPRQVSPMAFLDAPRLHRGGFMPGEIPIIAQMHERVLTEAQQRNTADTIQGLARMAQTPAPAPEINIEIIDQRGSGEPVQAERFTRPDGGQGLRLTIRDVTRGLFTSGAFDGVLNNNFGIKRKA